MTEIPAYPAPLVAALRERLPDVAVLAVRTIIAEVPSYANALSGPMGAKIRRSVQLALAGFVDLLDEEVENAAEPTALAKDYSYQLGRGEARSGRTVDALLAAFRIGARVCWEHISATAVRLDAPADLVAGLAGVVFAYIDELSAASVAGHTDELTSSRLLRQRLRDRMIHLLLTDSSVEAVREAAATALWEPPTTLTAVLVPEEEVRRALTALPPGSLEYSEDVPGLPGRTLVLVPDVHGHARGALGPALRATGSVAGPAQPWTAVRISLDRARRALDSGLLPEGGDTEDHLPELVLTADPEALAELRARALAPLADLRPATAARLTETLRSWLLHQGRRDAVAEELFVHPQTVRYRVGQLRELFGDRLTDPRAVLELVVALGVPPEGERGS